MASEKITADNSLLFAGLQMEAKWDWRNIKPGSTSKLRKVIGKAEIKPTDKRDAVCCYCNVTVNPGMCYRGKAIKGFSELKREKVRFESVTNQPVVVEYRIPVIDYAKGYLCDSCASDYSVVYRHNRDGSVESFAAVVTDPLPSLTVRDEIDGQRSYKGFNTRITQ